MERIEFIDVQLTGTTDESGDLTVNGDLPVMGVLYAVEWIDGSFDDGVDAVITVQNTPSGVAQTLLTLTDANDDKWYFPRVAVHSNAGADLTYDGTYVIPTMSIVVGTPRMVVAQGGDTKTGGCVLWIQV